MIGIKHKGDFNNTRKFFQRVTLVDYRAIFERYGRLGASELARVTPVRTGETADSWDYQIVEKRRGMQLVWTNSNVVDGYKIAILLQYGHGTRNGGYVQGIDYINPLMRPIFEQMAKDLWREVRGA